MISAFMRLPSGVRLTIVALGIMALAAVACEPSPGAGGWN
jgi:hypothetical protein